jgi:hypothetical protein
MAVLTDPERQAIRNYVMRRWGVAITKADLRAAIDATDDWINSNAAAYNSALPAAAQAGLSATEKTVLFCVVALKRAGFGEVV